MISLLSDGMSHSLPHLVLFKPELNEIESSPLEQKGGPITWHRPGKTPQIQLWSVYQQPQVVNRYRVMGCISYLLHLINSAGEDSNGP